MVTKVKLPSGNEVHVASTESISAIRDKQFSCEHKELLQKDIVIDVCKICGKIW